MDYLLKLQSKTGKQDLELELKEASVFNFEDILENQSPVSVCADAVYSSVALACSNIEEIAYTEFFLQDASLGKAINTNGEIVFDLKNSEISNGLIFGDCYGFVQLNILIRFVDGTVKNLYSNYVAVFFKDTAENQNLQKMAEYVYENYERFLYDDRQKPSYEMSIKEADYKNIETYIRLIKNLINSYDSSYSFFRVNAKNKIVESGKIDDFEKLSYIQSSTLSFISQHPEELIPVNTKSGIKIGRNYYRPMKTLVSNNVFTYNLYENKVLIGFLKYLHSEIKRLLQKIDNLFFKIITTQSVSLTGYISSVQYIFQGTMRRLEKNKEELLFLKDNIVRLYYAYFSIFNFEVEEINRIPEPTPIFMSIPQYNVVFNSIVQWFKFGGYNLEKEECLLPLLINNQLYEYYALLKILNSIVHEVSNNKLVAVKQFYYKLPSKALYRNTLYNNTFIFETPSKRISVFYQPVIFGQSYSSDLMENNSIGLYRNTTLRFPSVYTDAEDKGGKFSYYAPDYIIKIEKSTACEYIILDAKYSDIAVVKNHYFAALEYKYLFSINTEKLEDKIIGLYALCGKYNINDEFIDIYDIARQLGYSNNKPEAKLIPLFESETCVGYQQIIKHLQ